MIAQSTVPRDVTAAQRLREYVEMVREVSLARDPHDMLERYRARAQYVIHGDAMMSLSRRGFEGAGVKITRSTLWSEAINPWDESQRLPIVREGLLPRLMDGGRPLKVDELTVDAGDPFAPYTEGMRSLLAAPIFDRGEPAYMVILMRHAPAAFTLDELATLVLTTNLIGRATGNLVLAQELERARATLDRELKAVGEVQRELLPRRMPEIPGVRIAAHYETSTRAGGDYYNAFPLRDGRWGFIIADVSGHGAAAAVMMAVVHALLQAPLNGCRNASISPSAVLDYLNNELLRSIATGQFVTAFLAIYDPNSRELRYASAGHNPPRWLRAADRAIIPLQESDGMPLAITAPFSASESTVRMAPGDRILLYTDGITETFNGRREMFGTDGLDASLNCCGRTPEGLISSVFESLNQFSGSTPPADDRTLVALAFD